MHYKKPIVFAVIIAAVFAAVVACNESKETGQTYYQFNEKGELLRPADYRTWVFAGSGTTPLSHDSTALFPIFICNEIRLTTIAIL